MTSTYPTFSVAEAKPSFNPPASAQSNCVMLLPVSDADPTLATLLDGLRELRSMADKIAHGLPISFTPEVDQAILRAVRASGDVLPSNWARRLAEDVASLDD